MAIDLTPNLYAHWMLNETTGILASDSSVHSRDGTTKNMEDGDWVAGKLNNCLQFDGGSEYVDCGDIANFERTDTFSIDFWLKTSTGSTALLSRMQLAPFARGWAVFNTGAGKLGFRFTHTITPSNRIFVYGNTTITDNAWHHVVITYDGSSSASGVKIYIDGSPESLTLGADTLTLTTQIAIDCVLSSYGGTANFMIGNLDEVVIYDKVLSQAEVTFRWNGGAGTEYMTDLPSAPSNPDPTDTAIDIDYDKHLDWDSNGDTFDIYLGKSSPPVLIESDHPSSDYTIPFNLDSCTLYYWKIVAKNEAGETAGSEWSFTTNNELPVIPNTPSPINGAIDQYVSVTISWECEDYNPNDTLVYDIYFGETTPPPLKKSNHPYKDYNVSVLDNDKTYYWKIIAKDDASCGEHNTESPIWNFKTTAEVTGGFESFDPRKAYRNRLASLWNVNKDCDELEKCIYITDSKGDRVYIPMYLSEEVKSEQLPALPFLELEIPPGGTTYEPHDIAASTRKMESFILVHIYFTDTDNIDRTEFAKKIKDRLHDLTRYYQSITPGIVFMNLEDDGLEEESDGHRIVFHYIATLYCLYYDICT